ncbi:MAG: 5'-methylthioadenosine/S-adenosylhomocysteine nucleosidase [Deltaproteobacteria bacterium]|nr:5'-methylthioadenosine/S-adenosylhomocysteine nucleosidase [Deltaproteobacteria bacterium]MBW2181018.1 5'-methylthioadenosine/S-adenosylhomocysteine nucleosidase [Deltaproteobacteria bacterium]MBW2364131.1 5'-methylthioadenosine/S-adenosylhomocysteine nucleosidase [Deltaproteobacteria bacterium]
MNTCIIMATTLEAKPFIERLNLKKYGKESFKQFSNDKILLVISGVGKTNAAIAATYCCKKYNPPYILNMGSAGATDSTHRLGSILHVYKIFEHDRPQFPFKKPHTHKPDRLKGFPTAKLATGDRPVIDPNGRKIISEYASLVDMEAAAIAQACKTFKTKCYVFKYVSDTPDHTGGADILKNMLEYREPFFDFFSSKVMPLLLK